jgi:AAA family ATP:ADP antiporter
MYGESVLDTLAKSLDNPAVDRRIRLAIPGVLSSIRSQKSIAILERYLDEDSLPLRYAAIKALNKLRTRHSNLVFDKELIENRVFGEIDDYVMTAYLLHGRRRYEQNLAADVQSKAHFLAGIKARRLLVKALEERLVSNLERIFRLLGLKYDPKDMYNAYLGIMSEKTDLRANAVEFLDNVLGRDLKKILIPIVEHGPDVVSRLDLGRSSVGISLSEDDPLSALLERSDSWLTVCTVYVIARMKHTEYADKVLRLQTDPDPVIRETARYCTGKIHEPV